MGEESAGGSSDSRGRDGAIISEIGVAVTLAPAEAKEGRASSERLGGSGKDSGYSYGGAVEREADKGEREGKDDVGVSAGVEAGRTDEDAGGCEPEAFVRATLGGDEGFCRANFRGLGAHRDDEADAAEGERSTEGAGREMEEDRVLAGHQKRIEKLEAEIKDLRKLCST